MYTHTHTHTHNTKPTILPIVYRLQYSSWVFLIIIIMITIVIKCTHTHTPHTLYANYNAIFIIIYCFVYRELFTIYNCLHVCINYSYYIYSGESYAGIYVPTLVDTVMKMNERQSADKQINLKGFAVSFL